MFNLIKIVSRVDGFRRAGRVFSREGVIVDASELTDEQRDAIRAEPMLSFREVTEAEAEAYALSRVPVEVDGEKIPSMLATLGLVLGDDAVTYSPPTAPSPADNGTPVVAPTEAEHGTKRKAR